MNKMNHENNEIRIGLVYGSTREGRFCDKVAAWVSRQITSGGEFALEIIDPAAIALPARHEHRQSAGLDELRLKLERADAFIVVTPEYNHGYPAALKFLIDSAGKPWQAKPVAFVSYGGISGGLRAVEQLRLVFAELHAVTMRDAVSFANVWEQFNTAGDLLYPDRAGRSLATMLARLKWWAKALRQARSISPYEEAAA